jgi:hypothetical protein
MTPNERKGGEDYLKGTRDLALYQDSTSAGAEYRRGWQMARLALGEDGPGETQVAYNIEDGVLKSVTLTSTPPPWDLAFSRELVEASKDGSGRFYLNRENPPIPEQIHPSVVIPEEKPQEIKPAGGTPAAPPPVEEKKRHVPRPKQFELF